VASWVKNIAEQVIFWQTAANFDLGNMDVQNVNLATKFPFPPKKKISAEHFVILD